MVNLIIRWCLHNRFVVILMTLLLIGVGYYALVNIPIDAIPDIGEKQVIVLADWPGRSPQDVEDQVTYPLTTTLSGTPGVKAIRSFSGFGFSMVFIIFKDEVDYYWARSRVLERMNVSLSRLPSGVMPGLGSDATALGQVFYYTLEAEGADLWVLAHKGTFLTIPVCLTVLGFTVWLGFHVVGSPISAMCRVAGLNINHTAGWQRLEQIFPGIGREFMPPLDEGSLLYMPSIRPSASLTIAEEVIKQQDIAIRTVPEVRDVVGKVGRAESSLDPAPISMIETIITLKPEDEWRTLSHRRWHSDHAWLDWCRPAMRTFWPEERHITKTEILEELNQKAAIPGVLPTWLQPIQTRLVMLQTGFRAMMGVKIYGADLKEIEQIALQMEQLLKKVPGAVDVVADRLVGKPYLEYEIDREAAARYGVSIRDIQDIIEIAIGGERLTTTIEGRERYPIRVRYPRELRERFDDLEHILVPTSAGAHVPIAQVARLTFSVGGMSVALITLFVIPCCYCLVKEWQIQRNVSKVSKVKSSRTE